MSSPAFPVANLLAWFRANARDLPWRRTTDPYAIWVSEIMLQQTQVKTVIPYWERWMRELPDIRSLAEAPEQKLLKLWEGLGYYTRVRNLQKGAIQVVERHGGKFPTAHEDILALSGIGRYTAGAIGSIAFNQPVPLVDGNVIRVFARFHGIDGDAKAKETIQHLWSLADGLIAKAALEPDPEKNSCSHFNQALMELGATVCTPAQPACLLCPLQRKCVAFRDSRQAGLPRLGERTAATSRRFFAYVIQRKHEVLIRQRPADVVNARLWEFPNLEVELDAANPLRAAQAAWSRSFSAAEPLCVIKHSITRYRITLEAFRTNLTSRHGLPPELGEWHPLEKLQDLPFTSAHGKIRKKLHSGQAQPQ